jgi:hypothetical protein
MMKWNELPGAFKVGATVIPVAAVIAFSLADFRSLPADVKALTVVDSVFNTRLVRDSLRISDDAKAEHELRCLVLELFKPASQRRPQECQ